MAYKISELRKMSDERLHEISLRKHKKNNKATCEALRAQQVIWERAGKSFQSEEHFIRDHTPTGIIF